MEPLKGRGAARYARNANGEEVMGSVGPGELLIFALVALLLFGAGRIADIGKGLGQGIKNFKEGLKDEDDPAKRGVEGKVEKKEA
jgi:sec-independent protein translocase protein TatA